MKTTPFGRHFLIAAFVVALAAIGLLLGCNPTTELGLLAGYPGPGVNQQDENEAADPSKKEDENDLLKSWKKPLFAFFVTGRQHGYIEPCGCTGLYNQKGGLMRRHRVQQILQKRGWDLIPVDAGNQIRRFGQQPILKLQNTLNGLCNVMKYAAVGYGPDDLKKTPIIDLVQTMSNVTDGTGPFVSANVDLLGAQLQKTHVIVEKGNKKIGISHALDDDTLKSFQGNPELELKTLNEALGEVTKKIADCDVKVLLLQTESAAVAKKIATQFPVFDLLVHTSSAGEPEKLPTQVTVGNHTTSMIQVGAKGMYVGLVGCYLEEGGDGKLSMKYERIPLDGRFTDSKAMERVFENYQNELKSLYQTGNLMDVKPKPHPSGYKFVGSETCFECHDDEYEIWEDGTEGDGGPHFIATDDIVKPPNHRGHIPRHYDPECLSCHVTGWNPQGFYPYESGFMFLKKHKNLHGNGCENCHGPGSEHVSVERAKDRGGQVPEAKLTELREAMRLTLDQARNDHCAQCHDVDNSPDFLKEGAFDEFWEKIEH